MKPKILSMTNTEKVLWLRVTPSAKSVEIIDKILRKFDSHGFGLEADKQDFSPRYKNWVNSEEEFLSELECGYIIFSEAKIHVLLRKETKLFDKLKAEFLKNFEFMKPKAK